MMRLRRRVHAIQKGLYGPAVTASLLLTAVTALIGGAALVSAPLRPAATVIGLTIAALLVTIAVFIGSRIIGRLDDLAASVSLNASLARMRWEPEAFFTDQAAATPSLQLLLLKCLQFCRPTRILELGSGQTSKLLGFYYRDTPGVQVTTFEENEEYARMMTEVLTRQGALHDYRWSPLRPTTFRVGDVSVTTLWYEAAKVPTEPYDLILVDGPSEANDHYARSGFLSWMPDALAPKFIVIFDDADMYGSAMTMRLFRTMLESANREFHYFEVHGIKTHGVFCSSEFRFLRSI
jgi:predicted O-methyltransferase YrrM